METLYYIILVPMVYVAFTTFFIGTAVRLIKIFRKPNHPATLQVYPEKKPRWLWALHDTFLFPTVRRHKPLLWVFLMAFHICILLLIIGHLELFGGFSGTGTCWTDRIDCLTLFPISPLYFTGAGTFGSGRLLSFNPAISGGSFWQPDGLGPKMVLI